MTPDELPLVLSGPLVRRAEPASVSVWIALRESTRVRLSIVDPVTRCELMSGEAPTVRIGRFVHLVCVTATVGGPLKWGGLYEYDLSFPDLNADLASAGLLGDPENTSATLRYPGFPLPSFVLPPESVDSLRLLHGSCRKPHGEGPDSLATADYILGLSAHDLHERPQILMLTGDQIYADDVADSLLHHVIRRGAELFDWPGGEALPGLESKHLWNTDPASLKPGRRTAIAEEQGGLTGMLPDTPDKAKSHLLTFTEFATMHLCAWSDAIWPRTLPSFEEVHPDWAKARQDALILKSFGTEYKRFQQELERLERFRSTLPGVRRALANISTYMVCDDHEITDDWYFNLAWCQRVLSKELGRATIRNGMLAYAVFQAWGNTPDLFEEGMPGRDLLLHAADWTASGGAPSRHIDRLLSIAELQDVEALPHRQLTHPDGALRWHYSLRGPGDAYQLLVLDTRTWRGFPGEATDPSELISPDGIEEQVSKLLTAKADGVVLVVSSTPVLAIPIIQRVQSAQQDFKQRLAYDVEFWKAHNTAFEGLISALSASGSPGLPRKVVLLSGDVHFGYAAWLRYSANRRYGCSDPQRSAAIFAQLNASPFKNQTETGLSSTCILHQRGYNPLYIGDSITTRHRFAGWNAEEGPELVELTDNKPRDRRPDWQYEIGYVGSTAAEYRRAELMAHLEQANSTALDEGQEIVGVNHIGEVSFGPGAEQVAQQMWWHYKDSPLPYPLSRFVVELKLVP